MDAEKNIQIERREGDEILRGTLMDGQVRIMMCETTQMAQRAADIHHATPVCTAAMGRLMTATSMLGVMMKGENESVTVNIKGGGPMGTVVAVANHGDLKVCADDPQVELPLREDGKLNVGAAIGKDGYMTVIKDLGLREPYIGQIELVSGELGIDFANYYTVSEQSPSLVALGLMFTYMRTQRMQEAAQLLIHTDRPIGEIAEMSGYTNASKFAAAFQDVMGETPREFRQAHTQQRK